MKYVRKVQRYAGVMAYTGLVAVFLFAYMMLKQSIPDEIYIEQESDMVELQVPAIVAQQVEKFTTQTDPAGVIQSDAYQGRAVNADTITYSCRLFGMIPIKQMQAHVTGSQQVIACGVPIGIYTKTAGVLVIGMGDITDVNGTVSTPAENIVRSGDYITGVNGTKLEDKENLMEQVEQSGGTEMVLTIDREGNVFDARVTPVVTSQGAKLGLWVRDDLAGIGTMTYITQDMHYGALGHSINDADTGTKLKINDGLLYESDIVGIVKGTTGTPGELTGLIHYSNSNLLGTVDENTSQGIFGSIDRYPQQLTNPQTYTVGHKQEIETAPATIRCALKDEVREYSIQITHINYEKDEENKEIMFEVTDPTLLEDTGGIVQGMSGSPIIQNNKIIGAVTHVFVQDAKRGYGIFIEDMLRE